MQIWRVKELFVLGIVASTINALNDNTFQIAFFLIRVMFNVIRSLILVSFERVSLDILEEYVF